MKTNWLWDTSISKREAREILGDEKHPKFDIYAEKLLSRVSDTALVFGIIDKVIFCRKWPFIKKRIRKNRWLKNRIVFWQTIYERVYEDLKKRGIKVKRHAKIEAPPERIKIAEQIRNLRKKLGYTQKDLAERLGVIQQYISKIETGRENVSVDTLKKIADVFGRSLIVKLG